MHSPFSWLVALCAPGSQSVAAAVQRLTHEVIKMSDALQTLHDQVAALTAAETSLATRIDAGNTKLSAAETARDAAVTSLATTQATLADVQAKLAAMPTDTAALEAQIATETASVAAVVASLNGLDTAPIVAAVPTPAPVTVDPAAPTGTDLGTGTPDPA